MKIFVVQERYIPGTFKKVNLIKSLVVGKNTTTQHNYHLISLDASFYETSVENCFQVRDTRLLILKSGGCVAQLCKK